MGHYKVAYEPFLTSSYLKCNSLKSDIEDKKNIGKNYNIQNYTIHIY